jgi:hypothetical protein
LGVIETPFFTEGLAMKIDGACHCGRISFTAEVDRSHVMVCHCNDCQVLSGAPFRANVIAPIETLVLVGEPKSYDKIVQNGNKRAQVFCAECGTPLFSKALENATEVVIRLGCVMQRAELVPTSQIWLHSSQPWLPQLQDIPGSK